MADEVELLEAELVEEVVVVEDQVGEGVQVLEVGRISDPGRRRSEHPPAGGEVIEEAGPLLAERSVQEDDRRSLPGRDHRIGRERPPDLGAGRRVAHAVTALTLGRAARG